MIGRLLLLTFLLLLSLFQSSVLAFPVEDQRQIRQTQAVQCYHFAEDPNHLICDNGLSYQRDQPAMNEIRLEKRDSPSSSNNDTTSNCTTTSDASGQIPPQNPWFFFYLFFSIFLILFGGLMSGLTIGLMSLDITALTVLTSTSEDPKERANAEKIIPLVQKNHFLLVTLLLSNAIAMEALPIFLDSIVTAVVAVAISVTAVLFFGEIIPQALCKKYGIAIGANTAWIVKILMFVLSPVAWPISKLLDYLLGEGHATYYRRSELKELIKLHGVKTSNNIDPLTFNEIILIRAALEMKEKSIENVMTPASKTFMLSDRTLLSVDALKGIVDTGFTRIPVYSESDRNLVLGILLLKKLLLLDHNNPPVVGQIPISSILKVQKEKPLFDMLNEFILSTKHMAAVYDGDTFVGIVTVEDIVQELIQDDMADHPTEHVDKMVQLQFKLKLYTHDLASKSGALNRSQSHQLNGKHPPHDHIPARVLSHPDLIITNSSNDPVLNPDPTMPTTITTTTGDQTKTSGEYEKHPNAIKKAMRSLSHTVASSIRTVSKELHEVPPSIHLHHHEKIQVVDVDMEDDEK